MNAGADVGAYPLMIPDLYEMVAESPAGVCDIPMELLHRLTQEDIDTMEKISGVTVAFMPTLSCGLREYKDIRLQRQRVTEVRDLYEKVHRSLDTVKNDGSRLHSDISVEARTLMFLMSYYIDKSGALIAKHSAEEIDAQTKIWEENAEAFYARVIGMLTAFYAEPDINFNPKASSMTKAKYAIDGFLDKYFDKADSS